MQTIGSSVKKAYFKRLPAESDNLDIVGASEPKVEALEETSIEITWVDDISWLELYGRPGNLNVQGVIFHSNCSFHHNIHRLLGFRRVEYD